MEFAIEPLPVPLTTDATETLRVGGTRIPLDSIVAAYRLGSTPEDIVRDFPTLQLADVYTVVAFYLQRRSEVDGYLAERAETARQIRVKIENDQADPGLKQRLLDRRGVLPGLK